MREILFSSNPLVGALALSHGFMVMISASAQVVRRKRLYRLVMCLFLATFLLNTWIIVHAWVERGRPPFKTLYETMLFYPWCVGLVTLLLVGLHRLYVLVPFAAGISLAGLGYALTHPDLEIINLPPALQSAWFVPHVITYFLAYAALFASFVLALLALCDRGWTHIPHVLDDDGRPGVRFAYYAHAATMLGVCALTLGLVMGAVWGKVAWGDYWSWDPKENWALVSWLAYMIYAHLRLVDGWRGRKAMWLLVLSFGAIVFTYLGMHLLPSSQGSLHVYQ